LRDGGGGGWRLGAEWGPIVSQNRPSRKIGPSNIFTNLTCMHHDLGLSWRSEEIKFTRRMRTERCNSYDHHRDFKVRSRIDCISPFLDVAMYDVLKTSKSAL
jgi:hypothetical protein